MVTTTVTGGLGELAGRRSRAVAAADHERAAVDPHHHRRGCRRRSRGVQTSSVRQSSLVFGSKAGESDWSWAQYAAGFVAIERPRPRRGRLRRLPPQIADRRRGERDAEEHARLAHDRALHCSPVRDDESAVSAAPPRRWWRRRSCRRRCRRCPRDPSRTRPRGE